MIYCWKLGILIIMVLSHEVASDYILEVVANEYSNPSGRCISCRNSSAQLSGCCDNGSDNSTNCEGPDMCDSGFLYCLRSLGHSRQPEAGMSRQFLDNRNGFWDYMLELCKSTTTVKRGVELINNTNVDFGIFNYNSRNEKYEENYQGIQIVIVIYDVNSPESTNDVIDVFIVDITSSPGVQLPLRQYHGIYRIVQASFSFKVTCASGFYGPDCSTNCTGPVRTDCLECKTGYYGQFCSIRQDSCELNSCYNNGNCLQNGSCVCNKDYSGQFCQYKIDDCQNVDCRNGTCIDGINSYNCSCHIDYTGPHCDQVVNDCHLEGGGSPCAANSQCVDQMGGFQCICQPDYTSRLCDTRIDHCVGVVCTGAKTLCVDEVNSFRCDCKEGFTGENCDLPSKSGRRNSNSCFSQILFISVVCGVGVTMALLSALLTACICGCVKWKSMSHPAGNLSVNQYVHNTKCDDQEEDIYDNVDLL